MKLLVATKLSQGMRPNDLCTPKEGEIVIFGYDCHDPCCRTCRYLLFGADTTHPTTTFRVEERYDLDQNGLALQIMSTFARNRQGTPDDLMLMAREQARVLNEIAEKFELDTVLERNGPNFTERKLV